MLKDNEAILGQLSEIKALLESYKTPDVRTARNSIKSFSIISFSFDSDAGSVEKLNGMMEKDKFAAACDDLISEGAVRNAACLI